MATAVAPAAEPASRRPSDESDPSPVCYVSAPSGEEGGEEMERG